MHDNIDWRSFWHDINERNKNVGNEIGRQLLKTVDKEVINAGENEAMQAPLFLASMYFLIKILK